MIHLKFSVIPPGLMDKIIVRTLNLSLPSVNVISAKWISLLFLISSIFLLFCMISLCSKINCLHLPLFLFSCWCCSVPLTLYCLFSLFPVSSCDTEQSHDTQLTLPGRDRRCSKGKNPGRREGSHVPPGTILTQVL